MKFDKQTFEQIKKLELHDASIEAVSCDYKNRKLLITLQTPDSKQNGVLIELDFSNVLHIEIPIFAPWGEGYYVNEVTASDRFISRDTTYSDNKDQFATKILLNSGDEIAVIATTLVCVQKAKTGSDKDSVHKTSS